jgi:Tfp pilus assembly PilM family ATPase
LHDLWLPTMATLFPTLNQLRQRLFGQSFGWTGVEVGCHTINMAQVRKIEERWVLAAVWSVKHPIAKPNESATTSSSKEEKFGWLSNEAIFEHGLAPTLKSLENLNSLFQGPYCAATLTDRMIDYRELDLPIVEPTESKEMVRSEIALEVECELEELSVDCWDLAQSPPRAGTSCFGAVSIKRSAALMIASDLLRAGFECQTLDAVPCAMARSTSMVVSDESTSTLAIDIGYGQATITLVKAGIPVLSRGVRNLGLVTLLDQIASSFDLSWADAQTLLFQSPNNTKANTTRFTSPLQQQILSFQYAIANEIDKTAQYVSRSHRSEAPDQVLLMGAGARIPFLNQAIEERAGLPTQSWAIDLSVNLFGSQPIANYAIAAGLSALAWEFM